MSVSPDDLQAITNFAKGTIRSVLVTRRKDGSLAIAAWNLFLPEDSGSAKTIALHLGASTHATTAHVTIVDKDHGSPLPTFDKLGKPTSPTTEQINQLRRAAAMPSAQTLPIANRSLTLTLQPHALALIEIKP